MKKELMSVATDEQLALLRQEFPVEQGFTRTLLPRLGMDSQDKTTGKGKLMKVVSEAGTFYTEHQTDEEDENGKKVWERTELGSEINAIILYQRKQLSYYDQPNNTFISSPVYDSDDEILPLFAKKTEIDRGTPAELRSREQYQGLSAKGKPMSKLKDNRVLYVLLDGTLYQMTLSGTSMYSFMKYARSTLIPSVITGLTSEPQQNGATEWNMMTFKALQPLNAKEVSDVIEQVREIKEGIQAEKQYYSQSTPTPSQPAIEGGGMTF